MTETLPCVYRSRHGDTAWTVTGQSTGLTDLPLTAAAFTKVFTSPLRRAAKTCELAGFGATAEIDPDPVEWNYGEYEGLRSDEIPAKRPDWELFRDGCPGGESPAQVGEGADLVVQRILAVARDVLLSSSGHFIRVLAARWLALGAGSAGNYFLLNTVSLSAVSYEHNLSEPGIRL
jgi:broad specificity phosphatase PhoE